MELLKNILNQLGVDNSFFYQFALVLIAYFVLSKGVFKPLLAILLVRKEKTYGRKLRAEQMCLDTETIKKEYDQKWTEFQKKAFTERDGIYLEINKKIKEIIQRSNKDAEKFITEQKIVINKSFVQATSEMDKYIPELSEDVRKALLERS